MHLVRTDSKHADFIDLVHQLDQFLIVIDGEDYDYFQQFNKMESLSHAVVFYEHDKPLGCGAIKPFDDKTMEIKRMFILPHARGKGIATQILTELEKWTLDLGKKRCVLETAIELTSAQALYHNNGYHRIDNYGPYIGIDRSLCFEKALQS